jgi:serine/threonine-protein kinase
MHEVEVHVIQPELVALTTHTRFGDVMRRVMTLAEPHILPTFDAGADGEVYYYVTARRPAPSLKEYIRSEGQLSVKRAVAISRDIALALAHAHERGVRHGDLRPRHVGLAGESAVVASFGVIEACSPHRDLGETSAVLTLGNQDYLSPERMRGNAPVSTRSDVFALGCILFEMLLGTPPFPAAKSLVPTSDWQVPPALRTFRESVPETLERVVHTCLARVPADRYADAGEVLGALPDPN